MKTKTKLTKKTAAGKVAPVKTASAPPKKHTRRNVSEASPGTVKGGHSRTVESVLNAADEQSRGDALFLLGGLSSMLASSAANRGLRKVMADLTKVFRSLPRSATAAKAAEARRIAA